jgi:hypothetical protein
MKKLTFFYALLLLSVASFAQSTFADDAKTSFESIKKYSFKNSYEYVITFDDALNASVFVKPNCDYMIFFVYDNTDHPVPNFKAYLMTADSEAKKKYSAKSADITQIGAARVAQIKFSTQVFVSGKDQMPVKIEAKPKAKIYIFEKKRG